MLIGPLDLRKLKTRCQPCALSHLKCTNPKPCSHCVRRGIPCIMPGRQTSEIQVEHGQHITVTGQPQRSGQKRRKHPYKAQGDPQACLLLSDSKEQLFSTFNQFSRVNDFIGSGYTFCSYIPRLAELHCSNCLVDAVLAIGALHAHLQLAPDTRGMHGVRVSAIQYYLSSIQALAELLNRCELHQNDVRDIVLWTTLLLGVFELMDKPDGHGWQQHMVNGTAAALVAAGPSAVGTVSTRNFFQIARVFEIFRTLLSNETSFLSESDWVDVAKRKNDASEGTPDEFDSILNVTMECAQLRSRAAELIYTQPNHTDSPPQSEGVGLDIVSQGHVLRQRLVQLEHGPVAQGDNALLVQALRASVSIYLSGVFDYELSFWDDHGYILPILSHQAIQYDVEQILEAVEEALDKSSLSPLLFLVCLRIAGARATGASQRSRITIALERIAKGFRSADAIREELSAAWTITQSRIAS